jgi:hypothetical protein
MDEVFAAKLKSWLVSMMVLIFGTVSGSIATLLGPWCTSDMWTCTGRSAEPMALFQLLFPILASWHAFDLMQKHGPVGPIASPFTNYLVLFGAVLLLLVIHVLGLSGHFDATYCVVPEPGTFVFDGCETRPPRLLTVPLYLLLLFVGIVCMGKAVVSIRSRLKKAA